MYSSYIVLNKEVIMPAAMDAVQMNVRIDRELKREGDAALATVGYTPSQAVRALWENAVRLRRNPDALRNYLAEQGATPLARPTAGEGKETPWEEDEGLRTHEARMQAIRQRFADIGIDTSAPYADNEDDDDAREAILFERYWEEHR